MDEIIDLAIDVWGDKKKDYESKIKQLEAENKLLIETENAKWYDVNKENQRLKQAIEEAIKNKDQMFDPNLGSTIFCSQCEEKRRILQKALKEE